MQPGRQLIAAPASLKADVRIPHSVHDKVHTMLHSAPQQAAFVRSSSPCVTRFQTCSGIFNLSRQLKFIFFVFSWILPAKMIITRLKHVMNARRAAVKRLKPFCYCVSRCGAVHIFH